MYLAAEGKKLGPRHYHTAKRIHVMRNNVFPEVTHIRVDLVKDWVFSYYIRVSYVEILHRMLMSGEG